MKDKTTENWEKNCTLHKKCTKETNNEKKEYFRMQNQKGTTKHSGKW